MLVLFFMTGITSICVYAYTREYKKISCVVSDHQIISSQCRYGCSGSYPCYRDCYYGNVKWYLPERNTSLVQKSVVKSYSLEQIKYLLNTDYPLNYTTVCYYYNGDIIFIEKDWQSPMIVGITFLSLTGVILILWIALELAHHFKRPFTKMIN